MGSSPAPDCGFNPLCHVTNELTSNFLDQLAGSVYQFYGNTLASLGSVWVRVPTVVVSDTGQAPGVSTPPDAATAGLVEVLGYVQWITLSIAILALIGLGALAAIKSRQGEGVRAVGRLGIVLASVVLVSGASSLVSAIMPAGPQGVAGTVGFLQGSLWWYTLVGAVLSVLVGAARMIWEQRADPGKELVRSLLQLIVVAGAGVTIVGVLVAAADSFSVWVLDSSLSCDLNSEQCFSTAMGSMLQIAATMPAGQLAVIVLGIFAIIASLVQMALMFVRSAMLVLLTGVLPLTASATNTEAGRTWFKKSLGWLVAFILYKPVAALVYAAAFQLVGEGATGLAVTGEDLFQVAQGLVLMFLALLALPALMRFVSPMVAGMAGGTGGGAALAGAAAAIPTGAAMLGRTGGAASGSGGSAPASAAAGKGSPGAEGTSSSSPATGSSSTAGGARSTVASSQGTSSGSGQAARGPQGSAGVGTTGAQGAGATAGAGAGAGAGAAAAAGGPAGAAASAGVQAAQGAKQAIERGAQSAAGEEGPSGSGK